MLELQIIACSSAVLPAYGEVTAIIERDGFQIDTSLYTLIEGDKPLMMAKSAGLATIEVATQFEHLQPDAVIVVADRFETLAIATAASYMNIPLIHVQGGEISGSIDDRVRHAVTKLADLHFPATQQSYDNIVRMGENPNTIWLVGCPAIDIVVESDLEVSNLDLQAKYGGVGTAIEPTEPFLLVLQHPVTTEFSEGLDKIEETLLALHQIQMPTLMLWPNIDAGSDEISRGIHLFRQEYHPNWLYLLDNVSPEDYVRLLNSCDVIVGNSSSGIREGSYLGVPCVNIGNRQQGRERHINVCDVNHHRDSIAQAIRVQLRQKRYASSNLFGNGKAGEKIASVLASINIQSVHLQKRLQFG